ncbi:uncharacterized protein PSFLO_00447 [Pseudozyma flocculosa]|uniref:Uncharacterized protein n=1 Tax=Pseudozyma flocculosa TaxID=84751 RepID=A0A5C3ETV9_9BASI|nr:uncharacterized protein PSFLO_00447 [Pseudozyma flocculosa]
MAGRTAKQYAPRPVTGEGVQALRGGGSRAESLAAWSTVDRSRGSTRSSRPLEACWGRIEPASFGRGTQDCFRTLLSGPLDWCRVLSGERWRGRCWRSVMRASELVRVQSRSWSCERDWVAESCTGRVQISSAGEGCRRPTIAVAVEDKVRDDMSRRQWERQGSSASSVDAKDRMEWTGGAKCRRWKPHGLRQPCQERERARYPGETRAERRFDAYGREVGGAKDGGGEASTFGPDAGGRGRRKGRQRRARAGRLRPVGRESEVQHRTNARTRTHTHARTAGQPSSPPALQPASQPASQPPASTTAGPDPLGQGQARPGLSLALARGPCWTGLPGLAHASPDFGFFGRALS